MKEKDYRASRLMRELGVPIRYQIVKLLDEGPKTVGQLAQLL
ncbi:ArsR family transcriptional regulator, partial [candidate division TA06 bacterium]